VTKVGGIVQRKQIPFRGNGKQHFMRVETHFQRIDFTHLSESLTRTITIEKPMRLAAKMAFLAYNKEHADMYMYCVLHGDLCMGTGIL
jgi:hypothetical protein